MEFEEKPYLIYTNTNALLVFMFSYYNTSHSKEQLHLIAPVEQLENYIAFVNQSIAPAKGEIICSKEIKTVLSAIDDKYGIISKLFSENKLPILLLNNSHEIYNSICCAKQQINKMVSFKYELYLYHAKDNESGHPAYIFLHELGHIIQIEISKNPEKIPESFIVLSKEILGVAITQGQEACELFADAFAMAMIRIFDWQEYDSFETISLEVKNAFATYMNWLLEKF